MADQQVDARGHQRPTPVLRLRRAMERAGAGAVFELLADDPMAKVDVPHFCNQAGHEFLGATTADGHTAFRVKKCSSAAP